MPESTRSTVLSAEAGAEALVSPCAELLAHTSDAVRTAGSVLRERFGDAIRTGGRDDLTRALAANDDAVLEVLKPRLTALRPDARWVDDEL